MPHRYFFSIADLGKARGNDPELRFTGHDPASLAQAVQRALTDTALFERWRARQADPDQVDPALGLTDAQATASARQVSLQVELELTTALPMQIVRQRLGWLLGANWQLHDVRDA